MPADRADRLAQHARARHEHTLRRAHEALASMAGAGEPVTVSRLAGKAAVSRSWIYTQPELRDRIAQLQQTQTRSPRRNDDRRASEGSLRHRLTLAHQRITQLRAENHQLRQSLARAHGQLRAAKTTSSPPTSEES